MTNEQKIELTKQLGSEFFGDYNKLADVETDDYSVVFIMAQPEVHAVNLLWNKVSSFAVTMTLCVENNQMRIRIVV